MNVLRKAIRFPWAALEKLRESRKRQKCAVGAGSRLYAASIITNHFEKDRISIGKNSHIHGHLSTMGHGGEIKIGDDCFVGPQTNIWSSLSIHIGDRVLVSHGVNIFDTNSHSTSAENRSIHFKNTILYGQPETLSDVEEGAVKIYDDVWIGFNSAIMKGVSLGTGSIVAACSVVTKDVEPFTIVAGNPAKPIGRSRP